MTKGKESLESTDGSQDPSPKDWVSWLKDLATIAGSISAAAGIVLGAWTYTTTQWTKNDEAQRAQLSTGAFYLFPKKNNHG
jgi:hypothetical protein